MDLIIYRTGVEIARVSIDEQTVLTKKLMNEDKISSEFYSKNVLPIEIGDYIEYNSKNTYSVISSKMNPFTVKVQFDKDIRTTPKLSILDISTTSGDTTFSIINSLGMAPNTNPNILQFGDERFFYGNIDTYIVANVYKTIFKLSVSADLFKYTSNV